MTNWKKRTQSHILEVASLLHMLPSFTMALTISDAIPKEAYTLNSWLIKNSVNVFFLVSGKLEIQYKGDDIVIFCYALTSPAPRNKNVLSIILVFVIRRLAMSPARATAAVPWISSLNVQYWLRYFSRSLNAFWLPKSSNYKECQFKVSTERVVIYLNGKWAFWVFEIN